MAEARSTASAAIVESGSRKKLIVAAPGTGKTFTFKQALGECDGKGLALTFIRNLVRDLEAHLGNLADVFTFHGFCKHLLHRNVVVGLRENWAYYPPLLQLLAKDLLLLGRASIDDCRDVDSALHNLDESDNNTSLVGAKGLSAGYVFIVGFNDEHSPPPNQRDHRRGGLFVPRRPEPDEKGMPSRLMS